MSDNNDLIPVCAWVSMRLPGFPHFIGFTYVDSEAGLSAKGGNLEDSNMRERQLDGPITDAWDHL